MRSRVAFVLILSLLCIVLLAPTEARLATAPVLLTKTNSTTRALAFESISRLAEPFAPTMPVPFSQDDRTRVMLFATNLTLLSGDTVTAAAEDGNHIQYPLTVEYVGSVPGLSGVTSVIVICGNGCRICGAARCTESTQLRFGVVLTTNDTIASY